MKNVFVIAKREAASMFNSPIAYIFLTIFLGFTYWLFFRGFFYFKQASMTSLFDFLPWSFLIFIPAITMKSFSDEKRTGTIEILMTYPVSECELVLAKYISNMIFIAITLLLTVPILITVSYIGNPDNGKVICGYIGAFLLASSYISIGIFSSSLTKNQIVAFLIGIILCFAFFIIGEDIVRVSLNGLLERICYFMGLGKRYQSMRRGVIDSRDLLYYLSFIGFFYYMTYRKILSRN